MRFKDDTRGAAVLDQVNMSERMDAVPVSSADAARNRNVGKVTVAHLTSVHSVSDGRIYHKECCSLYKAGYDVVLVGNGESFDDPNGPRIIGIQHSQNRLVRIPLTWIKVLRAGLRTKAVLFHLHDPELIPMGLILKVLGKRVIFDSHEFYVRTMMVKEYIPLPLRSVVARLVGAALWMADRCFDSIVVATPEMQEEYSNRNVTVLNNYPEWEIVETGKKKFIERPPAIAYVGSISAQRGIRTIVAALEIVAQRTEVRLLLAGKFSPPELLDELKAQPSWRFVDYRGQITRDEVQQLLDEAICGLMVLEDTGNHRASRPNKLFEYMAVGLPTILSDFPYWRKLLDPIGATLVVDPCDPQAIAEKICWVLANRDKAEQMGKRGQSAVMEQFSWKSESRKLTALYREILGGDA